MIMRKFLIAGGNSTLLCWGCPVGAQKRIVSTYLKKVEQVGFVSLSDDSYARLTMMGNELCINATLALTSQLLQKNGYVFTSGISGPIRYQQSGVRTKIIFPQKGFLKMKNIVLCPGIGFLFSNEKIKVSKLLLSKLCTTYKLPAFGVAIYKNNTLTPIVYVKQTNSLFNETSCGSGSIAVSFCTGQKYIKQPTGETIIVEIKEKEIEISAKVQEITN